MIARHGLNSAIKNREVYCRVLFCQPKTPEKLLAKSKAR